MQRVSVLLVNIAPTMSWTASVVSCVLVSAEANEIVSVPAVVVIVTFVPPTSVNVSSSASATTSSCPLTEMVLNEGMFASPPPLWLIVRVSPLIAVEMFVPPAIVRVSPGVIPVEPESLATVRSDTAKSMSPVPS